MTIAMYKHFLTRFTTLFYVVIACLWLSSTVQVTYAQATQRTVTADDVNRVASELWCPLCSGVRLDSCDLKACEQMREEIAIKLEAGEDAESIKRYFFERYGEQVLGAPQREGWGWLAWLLPPTVVVVAGLLLFVRGRSFIQASRPDRSGLLSKSVDRAGKDQFEEKLDQELARYE